MKLYKDFTTGQFCTEGETKESKEGGYIEIEESEKAKDLIERGLYDVAVSLMDDEIRERIHRDLAPCTEEEFLTAYMFEHDEQFGEEFTVN